MVEGEFITCHYCEKFTNVTECDLQPPENCTTEKPYCKITQVKTGIPGLEMFSKVTTTKGCASAKECNKEDVGTFDPIKYIWCCQADLCNIFANMGKGEFGNYSSHAQKSDPLPAIYTIVLITHLLY
ncbi:ly6/PLAUR domain-containing protein 2-like [Eleutherodactylus coqui]|uniref:ly6/PLAUR domain-containing protein 2-like n=1 Tax=Eleutherodactylus coqui TaxID=57060 RepID=UPI00346190AA